MPPLRRMALAIAVLTVVACSSLEVKTVEIPPGADVFQLAPTLIGYEFTDSSGASRVHLSWLADQPYAGTNCIALSKASPADTTGTFVFAIFGANIGRLLRTDHGVTDTTTGIFLAGVEGTHGTWAVTSLGQLKLNWADGVRARYFDVPAQMRLSGDTIASDIAQTASGDSVSVEWHVRWIRNTC